MFIFAFLYSQEQPASPEVVTKNEAADSQLLDELAVSELVLNQEFLIDTHYISGFINLPSSCFTVEESVVIAESYPEQVRIHYEIAKTNLNCTESETEVAVESIVQASEQAVFTATINNVPVPLTLINI